MKMQKLWLPPEIADKIYYLMDKTTKEIQGLGKIKKVSGGFLITDAVMCECENTATYTEMSPQAIANAMFELKDAEGDILWWWHSHVDMGAFFSGTDDNTIVQIGSQGACVATVFNKKKAHESVVYIGETDMYPALNMKLELEYGNGPRSEEFYKNLDLEFAKKFKEPTPAHRGKYSLSECYESRLYSGNRGFLKEETSKNQAKKRKKLLERNEVTNLPPEFASKVWIEIDKQLPNGWGVNCDKMPPGTFAEWSVLYKQANGVSPKHTIDVEEFVTDMLITMYCSKDPVSTITNMVNKDGEIFTSEEEKLLEEMVNAGAIKIS